jgi:hypothetical protein
MGNTYRLVVRDVKQDAELIQTDGDLNAIAYHLRTVQLAGDVEYAVSFGETEGIGLPTKRIVSDVTVEGDVAELVLRRKLKQERAAEAAELERVEQAGQDNTSLPILEHDGDILDRVE